MRVAGSIGRGLRRGAKGGVRTDDVKQPFCIRPAMEAFGDEQTSLVPLVCSGTVKHRDQVLDALASAISSTATICSAPLGKRL